MIYFLNINTVTYYMRFFKNNKTAIYWIDQSYCQIFDLDHKTVISLYKTNQNKL